MRGWAFERWFAWEGVFVGGFERRFCVGCGGSLCVVGNGLWDWAGGWEKGVY